MDDQPIQQAAAGTQACSNCGADYQPTNAGLAVCPACASSGRPAAGPAKPDPFFRGLGGPEN